MTYFSFSASASLFFASILLAVSVSILLKKSSTIFLSLLSCSATGLGSMLVASVEGEMSD
jgi:hypothetical protein